VIGAISVHGVNGIWGVISVGLFANGKYGAGWNGVARPEMVKEYGADCVRGFFYGDVSQFCAQLLDSESMHPSKRGRISGFRLARGTPQMAWAGRSSARPSRGCAAARAGTGV
jgi:ammonium transporter family